MISNPLISVVMLTYNHELYIEDAINGVLNQKTDYPFELVIGEDCSTDKTQQIVLDYQKKYPDIIKVILSENNVGGMQNCLRTEKACHGKYVAYCEGDDYWHNPLKLQIQISFMEANPDYGMVHGNADSFSVPDGKRSGSSVVFCPDFDESNAYFDILTGKRSLWTLTVCVRKDLLFRVLQDNPECVDDHFLMGDDQRWLEISRLTKVKYFQESLATYRILSESATGRGDAYKALRFQLSAKEIRYHYLSKYECPNNIAQQTKYSRIMKVLKWAIRTRNASVAKRDLAELYGLNMKPLWTWKEYVLYWGCLHPVNSLIVDALASIWSFVRHILLKLVVLG